MNVMLVINPLTSSAQKLQIAARLLQAAEASTWQIQTII
jgi:hypothetical protein